jgi:hypothetical protein
MNDGWNLKEAIINHVDSGDLILDILEAQEECGDDKHGLGVRVANIINDFKDKVEAEYNDPLLFIKNIDAKVNRIINESNARGDFDLKQRKES